MNNSRLTILKRIFVTVTSLAACGLLVSCYTSGSTNATRSNLTRSNSTAPNSTAYIPTTTPTPTPKIVQTSKSLISANPRAQYLLIKRTYAALAPEPDGHSGDRFDIHNCVAGHEYLGVDTHDPAVRLADLAADVVYMSRVLNQTGYPESVWRAPLLEFENEQLALRLRNRHYEYDPFDKQYRAAKQKIVQALADYRGDGVTDLPEVVDEGECGAGEVGINVTTEPADGRVLFIPVFFYELCKAQQLDPSDPAQCDRWREPADGVLMDVSGDYFYRASWPGGAEKKGRLSFTNLEEGQTVTFRRP